MAQCASLIAPYQLLTGIGDNGFVKYVLLWGRPPSLPIALSCFLESFAARALPPMPANYVTVMLDMGGLWHKSTHQQESVEKLMSDDLDMNDE
jgi:hypothetical protein